MRKRLNRRSFISRIGGAAGGGALALVAGRAQGQNGWTGLLDHDQYDTRGYGRSGNAGRYTGNNDYDGADVAGWGNGRGQGGYTGLTDRDPQDRSGYGRSGSGQNVYTGRSDRDPTDRVGYGRGTPQAQPRQPTRITDSDPTDPPDYGRGVAGGSRGVYTGYSDRDTADAPGYSRGQAPREDCPPTGRWLIQVQGRAFPWSVVLLIRSNEALLISLGGDTMHWLQVQAQVSGNTLSVRWHDPGSGMTSTGRFTLAPGCGASLQGRVQLTGATPDNSGPATIAYRGPN